jgi:dienelactone hydrolase
MRVAALGYCFGGLCALDLARANPPELKGVISVHGVLTPPNPGEPAPIDASILILHGWEDPVAPPEDVLSLARELPRAGADWQIHAYGHARHAFTAEGLNFPERGLAYDGGGGGWGLGGPGLFLDALIGEKAAAQGCGRTCPRRGSPDPDRRL